MSQNFIEQEPEFGTDLNPVSNQTNPLFSTPTSVTSPMGRELDENLLQAFGDPEIGEAEGGYAEGGLEGRGYAEGDGQEGYPSDVEGAYPSGDEGYASDGGYVPEASGYAEGNEQHYTMTPEEEMARKIDGLNYLQSIQKRGYQVTRRYDINSPLESIETEVRIIKRRIELEVQVSHARTFLMFCAKGIEMSSGLAYEPNILEGWGERMRQELSLSQYDEVLSELCQKYVSRFSNYGPEIRLFFMLMMSAGGHAFVNSTTKLHQLEVQNSNRNVPKEQAINELKKQHFEPSSETQDLYENFMNEVNQEKKKTGGRKKKN